MVYLGVEFHHADVMMKDLNLWLNICGGIDVWYIYKSLPIIQRQNKYRTLILFYD